MNIEESLGMLDTEKGTDVLHKIYGNDAEKEKKRYEKVLAGYKESFGDNEIKLFTSPGRTEVCGNHTDHNHGKVLAGSINLDCVCAAGKNGTEKINIISESFNQKFTIALSDLSEGQRHSGTVELTKGIVKAFENEGFKAGGFDAYITSNVIASAGVSSSASYEMLICSVINELFNDGKTDVVRYAHMGKYSENVYWKKASGLMDQMACAVGGLIALDFENPEAPSVEKVDFDFGSKNYDMIMVQTGKGHADLSEEYSSIPEEMKKVAEFFKKSCLRELSEEELLEHIPEVRSFAGDRAVMRALHFFEENKRVDRAVEALTKNDFDSALKVITESGNSSWKWLQNVYVTGAKEEQGICVALALTEIYLSKLGKGACRVNGGGFAGVIQVFVPHEAAEDYVSYIDKAMGEGSAHVMKIRSVGAVCLDRI